MRIGCKGKYKKGIQCELGAKANIRGYSLNWGKGKYKKGIQCKLGARANIRWGYSANGVQEQRQEGDTVRIECKGKYKKGIQCELGERANIRRGFSAN